MLIRPPGTAFNGLSAQPFQTSLPDNFLPRVLGAAIWADPSIAMLTSGSDVTQLSDLSGNGRHLVPGLTAGAVTVASPTTTTILGNAAVAFAGGVTDQGLSRNSIGGPYSAFTIVMVLQSNAYQIDRGIVICPSNSNWTLANGDVYIQHAGVDQAFDYYLQGTGVKATPPARVMLTDRPQIVMFMYDGTTLYTYVNNKLVASAAATAVIGDRISIGTLAPGYTGYNHNMKLGVFGLFPTALSAGNRGLIYEYIKAQKFSSLYAGGGRVFRFNGTNTSCTGGIIADLDVLERTDKIAFTTWYRYRSGSSAKGSIFCHEAKTAAAHYKGWDKFVFSDRKLGWYASSSWDGSNTLLVYGPALDNNGIVWQNLTVLNNGGTAATTKMWYDRVLQALATTSDTLTNSIAASLEYLMGDADLDSGHDWLDGDLGPSAIILGQTIDTSYIRDYIAPSHYPGDLTLCPGAIHVWDFGAANDTTSTIFDRVGTAHLTVNGTGAFVTTGTPFV